MNLYERLTEGALTEGLLRGKDLRTKDSPPHIQKLVKLVNGDEVIWPYYDGKTLDSYLLTFRGRGLVNSAAVRKMLAPGLKITSIGEYNGMLSLWADA